MKYYNNKNHLKQTIYVLFCFAECMVAICGSLVVLEYSSAVGISALTGIPMNIRAHLQGFGAVYLGLNCATLTALWIVLMILCNRVWLAGLLQSCICSIIAIINYYVVQFHGMPLSFLSLRNFSTAMNVLESYHFNLDAAVIKLIILFAAMVMFALMTFFVTQKQPRLRGKKRLLGDVASALLCAAILFACYGGSNPVKPSKTIGWNWSEAYKTYGYTACTVETLNQLLYVANEPEGYSEDAVEAIEIVNREKKPAQTPDVILILNETFYDLREIVTLEEDTPFLENIESMNNLLSGYAVVPSNGGGTNSAEYELLTSNSLELMPGVTPFNTLDLTGANSIVSHMNALGYSTLGTHTAVKENYSRGVGYEKLAFGRRYFQEAYTGLEYYHDRYYASDESVYQNLIRWYEESPEGQPRFLYVLTIQNHGGYSWNAADVDTVHAGADFGGYDDEVDEFLTAIDQSDMAFVKLTEYFAQSDRPVIICMMGDHSPSFAKSIVSDMYSEDEKNLLLRKVPLIIWANYELEKQDLGTMSMNYVVPTLLDIAGIELSPYYQYLLQIKEQVPILTSYGDYYDSDGNLYKYEAENVPELDALVDNYFYLEYHNLQKERNQTLFDPYN